VTEVAPVSRSKADARATYDRRSRSYERLEGRFERHARVLGEDLLGVATGERVLEIGSGPGESLAAFAAATGRAGHVVGLDTSPLMHRVAAERLGRDGVAAAWSLVLGDGARLPLRDASVDAVFASFTLELFDTPELTVVLDEIRRVVVPGGRLALVGLTATEPPALMERAYLLAHRLMPRLADCRPIPVSTLVAEAGFRLVAQRRCDVVGIPTLAVLARREV
jgi:ubiquinone/menaquinone biosynthesis C-methylase UbiE